MDGLVSADYRFVDALDRALLGVKASNPKIDISGTAAYLLGKRVMKPGSPAYPWALETDDQGRITAGGAFVGDEKHQKDYQRWLKAQSAISKAVDWSIQESRFWNPAQELGANDILLGSGDAVTALAVYGFTPE